MNASTAPVELPPRYYLGNFQRLCDTVAGQYADLLEGPEQAFLTRFAGVGEEARCLYVRLVSRRGPLFRSEALNYPELGELAPALEEGLAAGLLRREESPDFHRLAALLRKAELLGIYPDVAGRSLRKPELVQTIYRALPEEELLQRWRDWRDDDWLVAPEHLEAVELFQLLFFGNAWQGLTDFVLSDLGFANYHPYSLDADARLFSDREEIEEYRELLALKAAYKAAVATDDPGTVVAAARLLAEPGRGVATRALRDRLRNRVGRQLERYGMTGDACALYRACGEHPARQRLARLLAEREPLAALDLCEAIQREPWCEAEVDFARRTLPTLNKRVGREARPAPRDRFAEDRLVLPRDDRVERAAATHYAENWPEVYYVENWLVNASFGLAFWEQIFAPVPGAFINPFQAAPLDMYSRDFYRHRREALDARLAELARGQLAEALLSAFDRYQGTTNAWVGWRGGSRELLESALGTIPREHWLAIWRRILFDPEANRNGCPDLIALDPGRDYCLIEVKGPGDQLQLNQRRWLRFFAASGIPARVARVSWRDG